jgi:uncharacterized membrane protein
MNENPEFWKWNIFYFNQKDKRLFVPKRIPSLGMTINFAHPAAFLIAVLFIILIMIVAN